MLADRYNGNTLAQALCRCMEANDYPNIAHTIRLQDLLSERHEATLLDTMKRELLEKAFEKYTLDQLEEKLGKL